MKKSVILSLLLIVGFSQSYAEETMAEKGAAMSNTVKRNFKKGVNRTKEFVCAEGDAKCLAKKAEHRLEEGADYVKDKAVETKDKIDK